MFQAIGRGYFLHEARLYSFDVVYISNVRVIMYCFGFYELMNLLFHEHALQKALPKIYYLASSPYLM